MVNPEMCSPSLTDKRVDAAAGLESGPGAVMEVCRISGMEDGGRPSGIGLQEQVPNHHKRLG